MTTDPDDPRTGPRRAAHQRIETPRGRTATRARGSRCSPQEGVPRDPYEKIADAATVHRFTGVAPTRRAAHPVGQGRRLRRPGRATPPTQGIALGTINSNVFQDNDYMLGSVTNPDAGVRRKAIGHLLECVDIMDPTGSRDLKLWFSDGTNYPGQDDIRARQDRLAEALARDLRPARRRAADAAGVQAVRAGVLHDRRAGLGHRLRCTASQLGERAQVVIDTGHHAPGTNIEFIVALLLRAGRLGGFDFNSRFYADDDLMVGVGRPVPAVPDHARDRAGRRARPGAGHRVHARPVPQHRAEDPGGDPLGDERAGGHGQGAAGRPRRAARRRSRPATCWAPTRC